MMLSLPKYDCYKDSGVDWLGEIPAHWTLSSIKAVTQLKSKKNRPDLQMLSIYREYGVIPKDSRDDNHNATALDISTYKVVDINDLVINKMKAWQGSMGVSEYQGLISPAYIICKIKTETSYPKFLHYLLRSKIYITTYNALSYGVRIGQWDMHYEDFKKIPIVLPPLEEQEKIVKFLDKKCEEVGRALALKKRLIELLDEQRAIVINQAITKGLNPHAPMKDSGIDWLGDIPTHWELDLGRNCFQQQEIKNKGNIIDTVLSLSYGKIIIKPPEKLHGLVPESFETYQIVDVGNIIIRSTDLQNDKVSLRVGFVENKGIITSAYLCLKMFPKIIPNFAYYLLHSYDVLKIYYGMGSGLRQNLSFKDFKYLPLPLPPKTEQQEIVNFIKQKTAEIKELKEKTLQQIEKLKEFKQILIAEAVTGKIKV